MNQSVSFRRESVLVEWLLDSIEELVGYIDRRHLTVSKEVPVGSVIPDLVMVGSDMQPDAYLKAKKLGYIHFHLLWLIRQQGACTPAALAKLSYLSTDEINLKLKNLEKAGLVVKRNRSFEINETVAEVQACVVSIEVKLTKWRDALEQAISYRAFSDAAFVILDANTAPEPTKIADVFENAGIGLIYANGHKLRCIRGPQYADPTSPYWEYLVGRTFARQSDLSTLSAALCKL